MQGRLDEMPLISLLQQKCVADGKVDGETGFHAHTTNVGRKIATKFRPTT
jgi:hypothetical protein